MGESRLYINLSINRRMLPGALSPWHWRGLKIWFNRHSAIRRHVRIKGAFEEPEIDLAAALYFALYPERCIVDVGANVGLHSMAWSRFAPVVALEPAPGVYERLSANIAANGLQDRVRTLRSAAADSVGEVEFFIAKENEFSSMKDTGRKRIKRRVRVPCTTLDSLQLPPVGLLKIDVEGFEHTVIAGADALLRRDRPVLFVEIYGGRASNPDPEKTVQSILSYGYRAYAYAPDAGLLPYERHRDDRQNYFFVPA